MGEGIRYGEFIWILDQLFLEGIKRYALVKYSFFIFPNELQLPPGEKGEIIPLFLENDVIRVKMESSNTWWDQFVQDLESQLENWYWHIKYNYLLIAGFILLIVIPFFFRLKKYVHFIGLNTTNRV
jgi:hypothetical protein